MPSPSSSSAPPPRPVDGSVRLPIALADGRGRRTTSRERFQLVRRPRLRHPVSLAHAAALPSPSRRPLASLEASGHLSAAPPRSLTPVPTTDPRPGTRPLAPLAPGLLSIGPPPLRQSTPSAGRGFAHAADPLGLAPSLLSSIRADPAALHRRIGRRSARAAAQPRRRRRRTEPSLSHALHLAGLVAVEVPFSPGW
ncbi:hypothetical protein PVAP13_6NG337050 [Panicum virgatum]|uniref:Uncharacterized protein n=1 Tax=Panicum virgatum TaxID=38727 RepID=A0A8T0R4X5_PANVG|nr:hypothetical protein PVAP13_6NG337050 [Panicum virgatum]